MKKPAGPDIRTRGFFHGSETRTVQQPDPQVQVGGEGHREEVGELEPGGPFVHLAEDEEHPQDQRPQDQQPQQGEAEGLEVEEEEAPTEIEGQLDAEDGQAPGPGPGGRRAPHPGGADAHQGKEDAPDHGKDHGRR